MFTVMFLHAGIIHLGLNMYALYLFGSLVEDAYGPVRFLAIYLVSGLLASVASFVFGPPNLVGVGASGAIFGLLGAWFAYNYRRREMRFHRANLQGAVMLIVLNLVLSAGLSSIIDWRAHVGGLVAGTILGFTAEGVGAAGLRSVSRVGGFVVLLAVGALMTVAHAHALTSDPFWRAIWFGGG
jgi:rhomboid protease GluP